MTSEFPNRGPKRPRGSGVALSYLRNFWQWIVSKLLFWLLIALGASAWPSYGHIVLAAIDEVLTEHLQFVLSAGACVVLLPLLWIAAGSARDAYQRILPGRRFDRFCERVFGGEAYRKIFRQTYIDLKIEFDKKDDADRWGRFWLTFKYRLRMLATVVFHLVVRLLL